MLGTERVPDDALNADQKVDNMFVFPDDERQQKHHARKMNQKGYRNLQLSSFNLAFQLVSLTKTAYHPNGSLGRHGLHSRMSMMHQKEKTRSSFWKINRTISC